MSQMTLHLPVFWVFSFLVIYTSGLPNRDGNRTSDLIREYANVEMGPTKLQNGELMPDGSGSHVELLAAGVTDVRLRLMQNQMDLLQQRLLQQESSMGGQGGGVNCRNDALVAELRSLERNITKLLKRQLRRQRYLSAQQIVVGNVTMDLPVDVDSESESNEPDRDDDVILMQQHFGGTSFFDKSRAEYRDGFGHVTGNYWLGNDRINELTKDGRFKLRVDLLARVNNRWYWAEYDEFRVYDTSMQYVLQVNGYRGNAGDALSDANGAKFSTKDGDHDVWSDSCAAHANYGSGSGFWYRGCGYVYVNAPLNAAQSGFQWRKLPTPGNDYTLMFSRMSLIRK